MSDRINLNLNIKANNDKSRNKNNNNLQKNITDLKDFNNSENYNLNKQKDINRLIPILNFSSKLLKKEEKYYEIKNTIYQLNTLKNNKLEFKEKDEIKEKYMELNSCFIDEGIPISNFYKNFFLDFIFKYIYL
jgi:hypothetical protein